jgi:hypothetical protein
MFEDVSHLIERNPPACHGGVAVADLGAGRLAFVVAGADGPNRVLVWSGGGLRDCAPPELADPDRSAVSVVAGDIDGDGREELYFTTAERTADRLFRRLPGGRWLDLFERPENRGARNLACGRAAAVIDRRGVGRYGFAVANCGRPLRLYEFGPGGALADLAAPLGLARATFARGVLALPLFSDHPDLLILNERGPNLAFRNRGDGTFRDVACAQGLADSDEPGLAAAAFDAGGRFGLCWGNADGPHRVMTRAGGGWKDRATPGLAFPSAVRAVVAADFDNDGTDELFFVNGGEPNRVFRASPDGDTLDLAMLPAGAALDPDGLGTGAVVCDIDGDGVLELLVARDDGADQPLSLYKARAAGGNWLRVRPLTRFGAPARGATVRAEYGGRVRVKGVCAGGGCQSEPVAHFGLGESPTAERVTVEWADGARVAVLNPGGNVTLTVPYPRG